VDSLHLGLSGRGPELGPAKVLRLLDYDYSFPAITPSYRLVVFQDHSLSANYSFVAIYRVQRGFTNGDRSPVASLVYNYSLILGL
jgi:hypothetical protein